MTLKVERSSMSSAHLKSLQRHRKSMDCSASSSASARLKEKRFKSPMTHVTLHLSLLWMFASSGRARVFVVHVKHSCLWNVESSVRRMKHKNKFSGMKIEVFGSKRLFDFGSNFYRRKNLHISLTFGSFFSVREAQISLTRLGMLLLTLDSHLIEMFVSVFGDKTPRMFIWGAYLRCLLQFGCRHAHLKAIVVVKSTLQLNNLSVNPQREFWFANSFRDECFICIVSDELNVSAACKIKCGAKAIERNY